MVQKVTVTTKKTQLKHTLKGTKNLEDLRLVATMVM